MLHGLHSVQQHEEHTTGRPGLLSVLSVKKHETLYLLSRISAVNRASPKSVMYLERF